MIFFLDLPSLSMPCETLLCLNYLLPKLRLPIMSTLDSTGPEIWYDYFLSFFIHGFNFSPNGLWNR